MIPETRHRGHEIQLSLHHFGPFITSIHFEADNNQPTSGAFWDRLVSAKANPCILAHALKEAPLNFQQVPENTNDEQPRGGLKKPWCVQFSYGSFLQDQDPVIVQHRVQPMGNCDDRARGNFDEWGD